ncbi:MAG: ATP-dependent sacrificial sulfur transferase LarE [Fidelibacterota bacterium]
MSQKNVRKAEEKLAILKQILSRMGHIVIGYSGGVDSTFLLKVSRDVLGDNVLAVIAKSETYPEREFNFAVQMAESMGVRYRIIRTEETDKVKFRQNPPDRCYYCKDELFCKLKEVAGKEGFVNIADGTNAEDVQDFRPGLKALSRHSVRSPLKEAGMDKNEIRYLSRMMGLKTWNKPSFACLSSRFPYGTAIDKEQLKKVDAAENFLIDNGLRCIRVRHYDNMARIEVGEEEFIKIMRKSLRERIVKKFKELGYTYVTLDLQGYRTGSMNEVLSEEEKNGYL